MNEIEAYTKDQLVAGATDQELIEALEKRDFIITKPEPPAAVVKLDTDRLRGNRYRVGVISDTHFGSKFQQPTLLKQHALWMKKRGVTDILVPGDVTDGSPSMHPGFVYETWAHGADAQVKAAVELFPFLKGVRWHLIDGNHDASHYKAAGVDPVRAICDARDDFSYLSPESGGHVGSVGYVEIGGVLLQLCHPHMGITRQRSYRLERWIETLQPPRPRVVIMGNFHRPVQYYDENRLIWGIMVPSFQAQSTWMASKGISSTVGSCILEFGAVTKGLAPALSVEWMIEPVPVKNDYPGG